MSAANTNIDIKMSNREAFRKKFKHTRVRKQVLHLEAEFLMTNRFTNETFTEKLLPGRERKEMMDHIDRVLNQKLGSPWCRGHLNAEDPAPYYVERVIPFQELVKCKGKVLVHIRTTIEPKNRLKNGKYKPYNATWFYEKTAPYKAVDDISGLELAQRSLVKDKYRWKRASNYYEMDWVGWRYPSGRKLRGNGYFLVRKEKKKIRDDSLLKKEGRFSQSQKYKPVKAAAIQNFINSDNCVTTPNSRSFIVVSSKIKDDILCKAEHVFDVEIVFRCCLGKRAEALKTFTSKSIGPKYWNVSRNIEHQKLEKARNKQRDILKEQEIMQNMPLQV